MYNRVYKCPDCGYCWENQDKYIRPSNCPLCSSTGIYRLKYSVVKLQIRERRKGRGRGRFGGSPGERRHIQGKKF